MIILNIRCGFMRNFISSRVKQKKKPQKPHAQILLFTDFLKRKIVKQY